jgi:NADPH2:quinone reductase
MRIWRLHELGDPLDVLHLEDAPPPEPAAGELQVAIEAVGLAFPDVLMCQGKYQAPTPIPFTPGGEWAGRVLALGEGTAGFAVGDRVLASSGRGLAEVGVASAARTWHLPDEIPAEKAVALVVNYGTTYYALHDRGHLAAGETLLVTGASGGTGSAAIQLGLAAGARVIAVAGGAAKADACRALGAHVVIDHQVTPAWVDAVRDATHGRGVDVAYDPVGGDTFHQVRRCMAWDGRLLVIGFVAGIADAPTNHILLKSYSVVGVHWGASLARDPGALDRQMTALLALAADGRIDPLLHPPYPMAAGARAVQDMLERKVTGKVVVQTGA